MRPLRFGARCGRVRNERGVELIEFAISLPVRLAGAVADAAKVREVSEKDVMNVLDMIRKEFNVDERRTYLMGHSMGGAGALYLGVKYPSNWAAIAAIAPAA